MAEEHQHRGNEIPLGGLFLIFVGTVLLLQTLNVLSWSLWETLWRFWPMALIATGLALLLRHLNKWLVSLLILVLLFACLGIAIWQDGKPLPTGNTAASLEPHVSLAM